MVSHLLGARPLSKSIVDQLLPIWRVEQVGETLILKTKIFFKENAYENVVCKRLFDLGPNGLANMIQRHWKYHAVVCSKRLYVKRWLVAFCSCVWMRLRFPYCNYAVEAIHNNVSDCVRVKTLKKTQKHVKSTIFPWCFLQMLPFVWITILIKGASQHLELFHCTVNMP